ncbi:MAG: GntR family transcriptional regulator [Blastopirellula sp.]|nr:MAG: GntR family transcriptional regulator [Blastopirellula sp.]
MKENQAEKSYRAIHDMLARGELEPGERLVNRTLAERIGVSVIPVREALHRLATEGLIEHTPGAGATVREPNRQDLEELYILRDANESCAAGEAAKYITDIQLEELEAILQHMIKLADQVEATAKQKATKSIFDSWLDDESQYHEIIVEASRNRLLAKVIREYRAIDRIFEAQRMSPDILTIEVARRTCTDRQQFLQALGNRDSELARKLMSEQIQKGRKTVLGFFSKRRREG